MSETKKQRHSQAATMLRVQGIISIIFGALGTLLGLVLMVIFAVALAQSYSDNDIIEYFLYFVVSVVFLLIPHVYFIVSGIILTRLPAPKLARTLTIVNLVVGAITNYILLAFAIISLVQSREYEEGYTA